MKIALDWIADYLSPVPNAGTAADALMNGGLPVESVESIFGVNGPTQVLDVEVTSNRTDCFSHVGLARELAAVLPTPSTFTPPTFQIAESAVTVPISIHIEEPAACPYYGARIIRNVKVGPSPAWLTKRLESIGLRSVNNIVDVTNFVLMELGQPLHAFDLRGFTDGTAPAKIAIGYGPEKTTLDAIDARTYAVGSRDLLIKNGTTGTPLAIAGIMGGKSSETTERTTDILLESAHFESLGVRTTSRSLGLKSDSSYRFERGIDPTLARRAADRASQLIVEVAGGTIEPLVEAGKYSSEQIAVLMRLSRLAQITGMTITSQQTIDILTRLGFAPRLENDIVHTTVPTHRLDVSREIDLIEEVARIFGYSHVPTLERVTHPVRPEPAREKAGRVILNALVEAGFSEAVTVTFIPEPEAKPFLAPDRGGLIRTFHNGWKSDVLRPSILPSLLATRRTNQNIGIPDARLFEKGSTFSQAGDAVKNGPTETRMIAAVATDLAALTAMLGLIPARVNPKISLWIKPADDAIFVRGAAGLIMMDYAGETKAVGRVGILTSDLQKFYDLRQSVAGMEIDFDAMINAFEPVRRAAALPRFPGIRRDLSIVVDEATRWSTVKDTVESLKLDQLQAVDFVTTFRNKQLGEGKKSLTLTLEFRDAERTLKSEEVDGQMQRALAALTEKVGATLRA